MYKATLSFTTKTYDVRKNQILADDFTTQDEINEYLNIGYIVEYDDTLEITENGLYDVKDYENADVDVPSGEPTLQSKTATPTTSQQVIEADTGYDGLDKVTVSAVTSAIDSNIKSTNIKAGVTILGVEGNVEPDKPDQTKTVTPSTSQQTVTADTGYELASVTVEGVTSSIDNNISAENIKSGTTILGVTGTYTSDADAIAKNIEYDKTAYVNGTKVTGVMPVHTYSSGTLPNMYTEATGFKNVTDFLIANSAVIQGTGGVGQFLIKDNKLRVGVPYNKIVQYGSITADKVKTGETIYGVTGTYTADADATASDIAQGKTAYVNGSKITGTLVPATPQRQDVYYYASDNDRNADTDFHMVGDVSYIPQQQINTDKIVNLYQQHLNSIYVPANISDTDIGNFIQQYMQDFQQGSFYPSQYSWQVLVDFPDITATVQQGEPYCYKIKFTDGNNIAYEYVVYYEYDSVNGTGLNLVWAGVLNNLNGTTFNEYEAQTDWSIYYSIIEPDILYEVQGGSWLNLPTYCQTQWSPGMQVNSFYNFVNGKAGQYAMLKQYNGGWTN